MELEDAWEIIRIQNEAARANLSIAYKELGSRVRNYADTKIQAPNRIFGSREDVIQGARRWWRYDQNDEFVNQTAPLTDTACDPLRQIELANPDNLLPAYRFISFPNTYKEYPYFDRDIRVLHGKFIQLSDLLSSEVAVPLEILPTPTVTSPPRYAVLPEGILARLVAEEIASAIDNCQALDQSLAEHEESWEAAKEWIDYIGGIIHARIPDAHHGFALSSAEFNTQFEPPENREGYAIWHPSPPESWSKAPGINACECSLIADKHDLARAYLAFILNYSQEVLERMPDYAEASGQNINKPNVSLTVSGGTINIGQLGSQIENNNSTIAGVAAYGNANVADALQEIQRAVMAEDGLDEEQKQELLESVGDLADAANTLPERRNQRLIKSALSALKFASMTGGELSQAMNSWGGILHHLLS